ncbi:MAG: ORF6N domain-containing protein [Campylobacterota bacterium]|nr:ORF6N domain-containing protein [Campylobacterota bacterium]
MNIISHNAIDNKIIELRDDFVIIDRDVGELYGVETKRINEAVTNNPDKFPNDYMFELTKDEKTKVVEHFDHLQPIKYSPYLPKAFTKKGLWMLATILSSKQAKETTFLIIETFDKIDNLKYNLKLLETTSDNKIKEQLSQKSGEIIAELLEVPEEYDTDTETSVEVNFGLLKYKRTVKKVHKKENAKDAKNYKN